MPIPLPIEFDDKRFHFKQLKRDNNLALFLKSRDEFVYYEVIIIVEKDGREVYPSSRQWGERGWSYKDLDEAKDCFRKLQSTKKI